MNEEKFPKPKSKEQVLDEVIERLEESRFAFVCFFDAFDRLIKKIREEIKENKSSHN